MSLNEARRQSRPSLGGIAGKKPQRGAFFIGKKVRDRTRVEGAPNKNRPQCLFLLASAMSLVEPSEKRWRNLGGIESVGDDAQTRQRRAAPLRGERQRTFRLFYLRNRSRFSRVKKQAAETVPNTKLPRQPAGKFLRLGGIRPFATASR